MTRAIWWFVATLGGLAIGCAVGWMIVSLLPGCETPHIAQPAPYTPPRLVLRGTTPDPKRTEIDQDASN